jgi:YVTN family beta-propeller protein
VYEARTGKLLQSLPTVKGATDVVVTEDESTAIVSGAEGNAVAMIQLSNGKEIARIEGLAGAKHIVFNRLQTKAYVTLSGSNEVAVIDLDKRQVTERIPVGQMPHGIEIKALPGIGGSCG